MYSVILQGNTFSVRDGNGLEYEVSCRATERQLRDGNVAAVVRDVFTDVVKKPRLSIADLHFLTIVLSSRTGLDFCNPVQGRNNLRIWIGLQISRAMTALEMTEEDLSKDCGIPARTIRKIEDGRYSADLETIQNITEHLGCTVDLISR